MTVVVLLTVVVVCDRGEWWSEPGGTGELSVDPDARPQWPANWPIPGDVKVGGYLRPRSRLLIFGQAAVATHECGSCVQRCHIGELKKKGIMDSEMRKKWFCRLANGKFVGVMKRVGVNKKGKTAKMHIIMPSLTCGSELWMWCQIELSQLQAVVAGSWRAAWGKSRIKLMVNVELY